MIKQSHLTIDVKRLEAFIAAAIYGMFGDGHFLSSLLVGEFLWNSYKECQLCGGSGNGLPTKCSNFVVEIWMDFGRDGKKS